jgi:hypothetical protein
VQGGQHRGHRARPPAPDLGTDQYDEPWRVNARGRETRHVPMQAARGDYALFFRKAAVEITFETDRYLVVPQAAILALVRDPTGRAADDEHLFD